MVYQKCDPKDTYSWKGGISSDLYEMYHVTPSYPMYSWYLLLFPHISLWFILYSLCFPCIHCVFPVFTVFSLYSLCFPCIPYIFFCIPSVFTVFSTVFTAVFSLYIYKDIDIFFCTPYVFPVFTVFSLYSLCFLLYSLRFPCIPCVFYCIHCVFPVFTVFYCVHWYSLCFHCIPYVVPVSPKFCYIKYLMVFRVWISNHAGCWETWEKCKKARVARRVFLAFRRKSNNIPSVWIRISKHGKPLGISFIK